MDQSLEPFNAAVVILQESIKYLPKNRNLIALTILPSLLLSSIFFLIFNFFYRGHSSVPFGILLFVYITSILAFNSISLFSIIATILLSSISYTERKLSNKGFLLLVLNSSKRPFIWISFALAVVCPFLLFLGDYLTFAADLPQQGILFFWVLYYFSSIVWDLGIVISVIEEDFLGMEALKKAGKLIKGKMVQGYILNFIFVVLPVVLSIQGFRIIRDHKWLLNETIFVLFLVNFSCLLRFLHFVAYTVLYFQCKKNHGEEIEFLG
ncbi:hypothetical protein ACH5RR_006439 [Cinchona calisaya]|uniref:Uncharacterized protein n=1 Tax=Cinchona calisaya TaxID=153742 RepID=A0ABD3AP11_9GENT